MQADQHAVAFPQRLAVQFAVDGSQQPGELQRGLILFGGVNENVSSAAL